MAECRTSTHEPQTLPLRPWRALSRKTICLSSVLRGPARLAGKRQTAGKETKLKKKRYSGMSVSFAIAIIVMLLIAIACSPFEPSTRPSIPRTAGSTPTPADSPDAISHGTPLPTDIWSALLQRTPFPYTTPLPPPTPTILDGIYTKFDPKDGTPVPCRRCPDYAPEGGIWKLSLDKGIFRLLHQVTGWRSVGSYVVSGNQLQLFNDPYCPELIGTYTWTLEKGRLTLEVIEDKCSIGLRAMNLTSLPLLSCQPPSIEAATSDHWPKPPGCY